MTEPLDFLYPPIDVRVGGMLDIGEGHSVWWEESGSPDGVPVMFLHGGPGAPATPAHRRFFDPNFYRLIVMHQRGCGKSRPLAQVRGNDTHALIRDIEALRQLRGVEKWLIAGGSWGSILSLAYGQYHPDNCLGFSLVGVTLARESDVDWWWNGTGMLFPEAFDQVIGHLPLALRNNPRAGYYELLMDPDPAIHLPAAKVLCHFSAATVTIKPDPAKLAAYDDPDVILPLARFFLHYITEGYFLRPGQILEDLPRITHLPCFIVGGRYDVTTPAEGPWTLHKAWPNSTITIVNNGAHGLSDPDVARAFLASNEALKHHMFSAGAAQTPV